MPPVNQATLVSGGLEFDKALDHGTRTFALKHEGGGHDASHRKLDIEREKGWTWKYMSQELAACRRSW